MTTTSNTPNTALTSATFLSNYVTWVKAHERLVLILVGAFIVFHMYDRGVQAWQAHDQLNATKAAEQVKTDQTANNQIQAQLTQLTNSVSKQQQAITALMSAREAQTTKQKKVDAQLTPSELAARFQGLLKVSQADVTSLEPSGDLVFTPAGAQSNIDKLEDLQQCTADRIDLKTELAGSQSLVAKQTDALSGIQKELADEKASHIADVKLEKARNHHTAVKWFKIGVVVGAIGTEAIRVVVGHP